MPSKTLTFPDEGVDNLIREMRNQRVILDSDLAALYGVTTKRLNEQFRRNRSRFPEDFAFQLTAKETTSLQSPAATTSTGIALLRSQFATLKKGQGQHRKYRPWVFTEHGALQAANILKSARAIQMSLFGIRAFVRLRAMLMSNADLARKLLALENKYDAQFKVVFDAIRELMEGPPPSKKPRIGFHPENIKRPE